MIRFEDRPGEKVVVHTGRGRVASDQLLVRKNVHLADTADGRRMMGALENGRVIQNTVVIKDAPMEKIDG